MDAGAVGPLWLELDEASGSGGRQGVRLCGLCPAAIEPLRQGADDFVGRLVRVAVALPAGNEALPDVAGACRLDHDGLRFVPHLPFEPGVAYRAWCDPRLLGVAHPAEALELSFTLPRQAGAPPEVTAIYPSGDALPENLLRFTVCFSAPMRRGSARDWIALVGPDGERVEDALYRAPVELWDRDMQRLTVLLDPGRLKRGVHPNRELGPPLRPGAEYAILVGCGMTDRHGHALPAPVRKGFRATAAVREPVSVSHWSLSSPGSGTLEPLTVDFPQPMDRMLLNQSISVSSPEGVPVAGAIAVTDGETRWCFTPAEPWTAGPYGLRVAETLEDVCGNDLAGPFERPLRDGEESAFTTAASQTIAFRVG